MLISCPACFARYEAPAALVTQKRELCCARCNTTWTLGDAVPSSEADAKENAPSDAPPGEATAEETVAAEAVAPERDAEAEPVVNDGAPIRPVRVDEGLVWRPDKAEKSGSVAARRVPLGHSRFWAGAWAASVVMVLLGVWSLCHWRQEAIHAWPPSARLFTYFAPPARTA